MRPGQCSHGHPARAGDKPGMMQSHPQPLTNQTTMKHTPGPWKVQKAPSWQLRKLEIVAPCECGEQIVVGDHTGIDCLTEANARLIAAAPDLLDALRDMVNGSHGATVRARAAIVRATAED